jgi:anti-repressor protein
MLLAMNNLQIFNNEKFGRVRIIMSDDKPMFLANDVARSLGYMRTADAISTHCKGVAILPTPTDGGVQKVKYIPESDVYRLVMRSKLPQAEQFQDWVCDEVLPSIRKTGGYMSAKETDTPEMIMARAVLVANDTIARQKQQLEQAQKQVAALAPKAELMDKVLDTDQKIDVGQAAKILNLPFGRNTLFQRLRERGIFFCNRNEPKQEYINRGYFELKEKLIDRNNHESFTVIKVLVTQKGLDFLARQFEVVQTPKKMAPIR